jgi:hypothetical protein
MLRVLASSIFFVALFWAFSGSAFATTFLPMPLPQMVVQAPNIVRGTIGATIYSDWAQGSGGNRGIYTFYQLQPIEVFKGDISASASILFREQGGEKDGIGMHIPGSGVFSPGEDVVVMLSPRNSDGSYDLRGLSSGKFNIIRQDDGSEALTGIALSPPDSDGFVHDADEGDSHPAHSGASKKWTISDLRKIVHDQGATPPHPVPHKSTHPVPSLSPTATFSAAPQLQPSASPSSDEGGAPIAQGHYRVLAFALVLAGLFALARKLKK